MGNSPVDKSQDFIKSGKKLITEYGSLSGETATGGLNGKHKPKHKGSKHPGV